MKKLLKNLLYPLAIASLLTACASSTPYDTSSSTDPDQVIGNKSSIVSSHRIVDQHYTLEVLHSGVVGNQYIRISSIELDGLPVIAAISRTNVKNTTLMNVLKTSGTTRISKQLMALRPAVTYEKSIKVHDTTVAEVPSPTIQAYLQNLGYDDDKKIIVRSVTITYKTEKMYLTEYILPNDED